MKPAGSYDLSALGWMLFQELVAGWLEQAAGLHPEWWTGHADRHRYVVLEEGVPGTLSELPLPGPTLVATAWAGGGAGSEANAVSTLSGSWEAATLARVGEEPLRSLLVLTDLPAEHLREALGPVKGPPYDRDERLPVHVIGPAGLGEALDGNLELRVRHPYAMGVREGGPALPDDARRASAFDLESARELSRSYVPSRPYRRALQKLRSHGFCVLTGPPEMGKTAAARMLGLALLTGGWEVHECTTPDDVTERLNPDRSQLFVADDAFGSTEYRPEAAERWARSLPAILRATDARHWLVWTSRPTPLKAGLRTIHRERGGERFPAPAEVQVDAADLDVVEKALILFRHARSAGLAPAALELVREQGAQIVDHRHFTPERIRRFVATDLPGLTGRGAGREEIADAVLRQIEHPTAAMATSYLALSDSQRALLVAMLDCPAGIVSERDLASAARRHAPAGLDRAPFQLVDRLADHFLRISCPTGVTWVHPSWRDLVIAQLAGDPVARRRFLSACGHHGALLALSVAGGAEGAIRLPLLAEDSDWDALGDRLAELVRIADERSLGELLGALAAALEACRREPRDRAELSSLASLVLGLAGRTRPAHEPVGVGLIEAWIRLAEELPEVPSPPWLTATWVDLLPGAPPDLGSPEELTRYEQWLLLAQTLKATRPDRLLRLGFPGEQERIARRLAQAARPLIADAPASPRAARISRLLLQAADLFAQDDLVWNSALAVDRELDVTDAIERTRIRRRHASAAKADHDLVDRVLGDLTGPESGESR